MVLDTQYFIHILFHSIHSIIYGNTAQQNIIHQFSFLVCLWITRDVRENLILNYLSYLILFYYLTFNNCLFYVHRINTIVYLWPDSNISVFWGMVITMGLLELLDLWPDRWCDFWSIVIDFVARSATGAFQDGCVQIYSGVVQKKTKRCNAVPLAY